MNVKQHICNEEIEKVNQKLHTTAMQIPTIINELQNISS